MISHGIQRNMLLSVDTRTGNVDSQADYMAHASDMGE